MAVLAPPATPAGLFLSSAVAVSKDRAVLVFEWDSVSDAQYYVISHVYADKAGQPMPRFIGRTTATSFAIGKLAPFFVAPGGLYTVAVQAENAGGLSVPSVLQVTAPTFAETPKLGELLTSFKVDTVSDSFQFPLSVEGPKTTAPVLFTLDTGAFEMLLTGADALNLGLPNLGALTVGGVGGSASAFRSEVSFSLGTRRFANVPCIVDPSFDVNLFGARFFIDNKLTLVVDTKTSAVAIYG